VLLKIVYLLTCRILGLAVLVFRGGWAKDAELLVLRHEKAVLRRHVGRVLYEPADRVWLAALARLIPRRLWTEILPVTPATLLAWHCRLAAPRYDTSKRRKPGRSPTVPGIARLVVRLAKENPPWGYRRIHGKPTKLGVTVAPSTVWEILRAAGIDPAPRRSGPAWRQFLHAQTAGILAAGLPARGHRAAEETVVLIFIEHGARRMHLGGVTANPTGEWTVQQARKLALSLDERFEDIRFEDGLLAGGEPGGDHPCIQGGQERPLVVVGQDRRCSLFRKNGTESCVLALSPHDGSRGAARRVPWDGGQKLAEAGPDLLSLDEKGIVAIRRRDDAHAPRPGDAGREVLLLGERVEAVAVDSRDEGACPYPAQRGGRSAAAAADVVTVHRLGQRDVAAGVESPGELVGMVVKIGLDGVPAPVPWVLAVLVVTAEACGKLRLAAVGDVSDPPGHAKAAVGAVAGPGVVVVAASPAAVGPDGVQLRRGPGDLLG
jgi:hypothetical protein